MAQRNMQYEGNIYRPPSEANSLAMDPEFLSALTLMVVPSTPIDQLSQSGRFTMPGKWVPPIIFTCPQRMGVPDCVIAIIIGGL